MAWSTFSMRRVGWQLFELQIRDSNNFSHTHGNPYTVPRSSLLVPSLLGIQTRMITVMMIMTSRNCGRQAVPVELRCASLNTGCLFRSNIAATSTIIYTA